MAEKLNLKYLTAGLIKENPVLVLLLGTCPTLAVTTMAQNGIGMGIAATLVLLGSNVVISLLSRVIPDKVRIPCYIVVIAGFVTIVQLLVKAYTPDLNKALGIYLPLIVVNCIILGRAEMFASKHNPLDSALDGIGMGLGFTLTLTVMATIREVLGSGSWYGIPLPFFSEFNIPILTKPAGGFFVFGCMVALVAKLTHGKVKHNATGCASCPNAEACAKLAKEG